MGRIFETRKATMFARWNKMAKAFTRISKDIAIAVKAGGPSPDAQPGAAARAPERARREHAEGQGRGRDQARQRPGRSTTTRSSCTRATRRTASRCSSRPRPTTWSARSPTSAMHFKDHGGNMGTTGSVAFQFQKMGVFRLAARRGSTSRRSSSTSSITASRSSARATGEKGEQQVVVRCAFTSFGQLQAAIEERKLPLVSAESEYVAADAGRAARGQGEGGPRAGGRARAGRRRPAGLPQPGLSDAGFRGAPGRRRCACGARASRARRLTSGCGRG